MPTQKDLLKLMKKLEDTQITILIHGRNGRYMAQLTPELGKPVMGEGRDIIELITSLYSLLCPLKKK